MPISGEEFFKTLFTKEALNTASDDVAPEDLCIQMPKWYDERKYKRGRQFFTQHSFGLALSIAMGNVLVLAVPSILRVSAAFYTKTSLFAACKRLLSITCHILTWLLCDLKPGSPSWNSLQEVRKRHIALNVTGRRSGVGIVSQRDLALAQFSFIGFPILKPDKFGVKQLRRGDWEGYNHFWRVVGHMVGIQDRYNICQETVEETRIVCQTLLDRVFTPFLENCPEDFEQMLRIMMDGPLTLAPVLNVDIVLYFCKNLANVPGYLCSESERVDLQRRLKEIQQNSTDHGIDSSALVQQPIESQPRKQRLLYIQDYDTLESTPDYKKLSLLSKWRLSCLLLVLYIHSTNVGRIIINFFININLFIMQYNPFLCIV